MNGAFVFLEADLVGSSDDYDSSGLTEACARCPGECLHRALAARLLRARLRVGPFVPGRNRDQPGGAAIAARRIIAIEAMDGISGIVHPGRRCTPANLHSHLRTRTAPRVNCEDLDWLGCAESVWRVVVPLITRNTGTRRGPGSHGLYQSQKKWSHL